MQFMKLGICKKLLIFCFVTAVFNFFCHCYPMTETNSKIYPSSTAKEQLYINNNVDLKKKN